MSGQNQSMPQKENLMQTMEQEDSQNTSKAERSSFVANFANKIKNSFKSKRAK
jgi:hypothetical protein